MRRFVFNLATVVSGLLFLVSVVFGVRSHRYWEGIAHGQMIEGNTVYAFDTVTSRNGLVDSARVGSGVEDGAGQLIANPPLEGTPLMGWRISSSGPQYVDDRALWPSFTRYETVLRSAPRRYTRVTYLQLPYWLPLLLSAALPMIWLRRRLRSRERMRSGRCVGCGYDLRASPGRCPECGRRVGKDTANPVVEAEP